MKKHISLSIFLLCILLFISCGKDIVPTTPQIPSTFKITDIKALSADDMANLVVVATYFTAKDEPFASGTLWLGDGTCSLTKPIKVKTISPKWKEIVPR